MSELITLSLSMVKSSKLAAGDATKSSDTQEMTCSVQFSFLSHDFNVSRKRLLWVARNCAPRFKELRRRHRTALSVLVCFIQKRCSGLSDVNAVCNYS